MGRSVVGLEEGLMALLEFRRRAREETRWVRETILGVPAAAA